MESAQGDEELNGQPDKELPQNFSASAGKPQVSHAAGDLLSAFGIHEGL